MDEHSSAAPRDVAQVLGILYRLTLDAVRCESRRALIFTILNQSHQLLPYDRAFFFDLGGRMPRLLGISGLAEVDTTSERALLTTELVAALREPSRPRIATEGDFEADPSRWRDLATRTQGLSAIWLPLAAGESSRAGLWIERWGGATWNEAELAVLGNLAEAYGAIWAKQKHPGGWRNRLPTGRLRRTLLAAACLIAFYILFLHRTPLRVVAPCEVIPDAPWIAAAPLDGVIARVLVEPGQEVEPGTPLYVYDTRVTEQDLEVARQQVLVIEAQLDRARSLAFRENAALADVAVLEHRKRQEMLRMELMEENLRRQTVRSEVAGVAMVENPDAWRGRPVRTGEKILSVLNPGKTRVRIWVAEQDNIDLMETHPVRIFLHVAPDRSKSATITYVSPGATESPMGVSSFVVEAAWAKGETGAKTGLRGTAMLYGEPASFAYGILRKPWTWFRRTLGF